MNIRILSAVVLLFVLICGLQAKNLQHNNVHPVPVDQHSADFHEVDKFVRSKHPELAGAKATTATVQKREVKTYNLVYSGHGKTFHVVARKDPLKTPGEWKVKSFA